MRIWCKLFKKNLMLKDTVIENYDMKMSRTAKVMTAWNRPAISLIWKSLYGWIKINRSLSAMPEPAFIRITLSSRLILIIWIFR